MIAECMLAPAAAEVDRATLVPRAHLDELADAGLYGLAGPGVPPPTRWLATEVLASGCMATTFVWLQHHGAVGTVRRSPLAEAWLAPMLSGAVRGGIAVGGVRSDRPSMHARRGASGWEVHGHVPWTTGWGLIDVLLVGATTDDGRELWCLLDAAECHTLSVEPLQLIAANASATVRLTFDGHAIADERIVGVVPHEPPPAHDGGGRNNGSLALGLVRRVCGLVGPSRLDAELETCRSALDAAGALELGEARAAASALALRATTRLAVVAGAAAIVAGSTAERSLREAHLTAVFGSRPTIRRHLLRRLDQ